MCEGQIIESRHKACVKLSPTYLGDELKLFLENNYPNLTTKDRIILGMILCLKSSKKGKLLSLREKKELTPGLIRLLKTVRDFANKTNNISTVVVSKMEHLIFFLSNGEIALSLVDNAAFGRVLGDKQILGDKKTPVGLYRVVKKKRNSGFTRFIGINYPTADQAKRAFVANKISATEKNKIQRANENNLMPPYKTDLGGHIGIHGLSTGKQFECKRSATKKDWTPGCIALENHMIRKYFKQVEKGTPVLILP
ncbi:murein L,D-transpeptidase family protein [Candidatus Margulisiibacteriota bacterium]